MSVVCPWYVYGITDQPTDRPTDRPVVDLQSFYSRSTFVERHNPAFRGAFSREKLLVLQSFYSRSTV